MLGFNKKEMNTFLKGYNITMKEARDETCERFRKEHKLMETKELKIDLPIHIYKYVKKRKGDFVLKLIEADHQKYVVELIGERNCIEPEEEQGETVRYMHNVLCEMDERIKALEVKIDRHFDLHYKFNDMIGETKKGYLNFDKRFVAFEEKVKRLEETSTFIKINETAIQELRDLIGTPYEWPNFVGKALRQGPIKDGLLD